MRNEASFSDLLGKTCSNINVGCDIVTFDCGDSEYMLYHDQDCCENVALEDVCGNWEDIIGTQILLAEEVSNDDEPPKPSSDDCYEWTFYKLATVKGYITTRWYGESNGYYSTSVDFYKTR